MLFVVHKNGVPSIGRQIRVSQEKEERWNPHPGEAGE